MQESMRAANYGILFDILYDVEFEWRRDVPRDADRADDGRYLRLRFAEEEGLECKDEWLIEPCSFLEFLISLAYLIDDRIMYDPEKPDQVVDWFWLMMGNARLDACTDDYMMQGGTLAYSMVMEIVNMIMNRAYDYNGYPGLFPLRKPQMDQRKVEIWYQANAYFIEAYFE
jgi:hypothetical protein